MSVRLARSKAHSRRVQGGVVAAAAATLPVAFVTALGAGNSVTNLPTASESWLPGDYCVALSWNSNGPTITVPAGWTRLDGGGATDSPALIAARLDGLQWVGVNQGSPQMVNQGLQTPISQTENAQYSVLGIWRNVALAGLTGLVIEVLDNSPANLNVGPITVPAGGKGICLITANSTPAASFVMAGATDRLSTEPSAGKSLRVYEVDGPQTAYQFTHDGVNVTDLGGNNRACAFVLAPGPASYAPVGSISYVGAGADTLGAATVTPPLPGSLLVNDLLVAVCHHANDGSGGMAAEAGWLTVGMNQQGARDHKVYVKRALGGGLDSNPTFDAGGSAQTQAKVHAYRGVAGFFTVNGTHAQTLTPARNTPVANCWALAAFGGDFWGFSSFTLDGYTSRGVVSGTGLAGLCDKLIAAPGAPGFPTLVQSGGSSGSCSLMYLFPA